MNGPLLRCDDGWTVTCTNSDPKHRRYLETIFTVGNGHVATRGACPELTGREHSRPATYVAGLFEHSSDPMQPPRLLTLPDWTSLTVQRDGEEWPGTDLVDGWRAVMDLKRGLLVRTFQWIGPGNERTKVRVARFASMTHPDLLCEQWDLTPLNWSGTLTFRSTTKNEVCPQDQAGRYLMGETLSAKGAEPAGQLTLDLSQGETSALDRLIRIMAIDLRRSGDPSASLRMTSSTSDSEPRGLPVDEHVACWARFWETSDIQIEGDPESQWKVRFALFHLWQCACENSVNTDASIGARGIHGEGYNGHVFWDTELYMLPFFTLNHPEVAKALLMYRHRRLPAARERAKADGCTGARFPWESADTGEEVTPPASIRPDGTFEPIATGEQEIHITADIAFAVNEYIHATGDKQFAAHEGAELLLSTAEFWVSRLEEEGDCQRSETSHQHASQPFLHASTPSRLHARPSFHISGAMGPDEYHEAVRDNVFTNALAKWNILVGADVGTDLDDWRAKARAIAIPYDEQRGLYPQFDGWFDLNDGLDDCGYRKQVRPGEAKDTQILKQADTLLILHLLPEMADAESRRRHYDYYAPRTTHESSLSPSLHAVFAAQAGYPDQAWDFFTRALNRDFYGTEADNDGASDVGVHAANLGGIWQAVVSGFGGLRWNGDRPVLEPRLPSHWKALTFNILWRGRPMRYRVTKDGVTIESPV